MQKAIVISIITIILATAFLPKPIYDGNYINNHEFLFNITSTDMHAYAQAMKKNLPSNEFARGDNYLILARIHNKTNDYRKACDAYTTYLSKIADAEKRAVTFETLASLQCHGKENLYIKGAIQEWQNLNVTWRVEILQQLQSKENTDFKFDTSIPEPTINLTGAEHIIIGTTTITINISTKVLTQAERVYRDWLGLQVQQTPWSGEVLTTFSERLTYNNSELRADVGWHEGGRIQDLKTNLGITPHTAYGTLAAEKEGKWYAPDDKGIFSFEIPHDKIYYPTTRFLRKDLALIVDTHGVNMLVEQAIRNNIDVILSDCDYWGKTKAALYLAKFDIKTICFPDRYVFHALGHNIQLVGSPTWKFDDKAQQAIYGNAPIELHKHQNIVVSDAAFGHVYALQYYNAPQKYFSIINQTFPLNIHEVTLTDFYQLEKVFDKARETKSSVVATRIFNSDDFRKAKAWMDENPNHQVILFHSTMYPYGILFMQEYEGRVSFNDPNIIPLYELHEHEAHEAHEVHDHKQPNRSPFFTWRNNTII